MRFFTINTLNSCSAALLTVSLRNSAAYISSSWMQKKQVNTLLSSFMWTLYYEIFCEEFNVANLSLHKLKCCIILQFGSREKPAIRYALLPSSRIVKAMLTMLYPLAILVPSPVSEGTGTLEICTKLFKSFSEALLNTTYFIYYLGSFKFHILNVIKWNVGKLEIPLIS